MPPRLIERKWLHWIVSRLPHSLIYLAALQVYIHCTTGKHGKNDVFKLTMFDALRWYDDDFLAKKRKEK